MYNFFLGTNISIINQIGRATSVVSAIIGICILVKYLITKDISYGVLGLYYAAIAFVINSLLVFILIISLFIEKEKENNTSNVSITIAFMLLNIPLATICVALGS